MAPSSASPADAGLTSYQAYHYDTLEQRAIAPGEDGDPDALASDAPIAFEDNQQSIRRLLKGLNVANSTAYPVLAEQSTITDFKAKFFSTNKDEAPYAARHDSSGGRLCGGRAEDLWRCRRGLRG
jgi:hypothetical protein